MTSIAVVAHQKKSLGGGLGELRQLLADRGFSNPIWYEVTKSRKAPAMARRAVKDGADLLLLWGGDGTVQRCLDALAGSNVAIAILPAGTANLLASNLGVPMDLPGAVQVALDGARRRLDVGVLNGERFAVMAGAGFDAALMQDTDRALKDRLGRLAYIWSGARAIRSKPVKMRIEIDGKPWFDGRASCLLLGNFGTITGNLTVFADAEPDDGLLEVAVVTAGRPIEWARVLTALAAGRADRSRFVRKGRGNRVAVKLSRADGIRARRRRPQGDAAPPRRGRSGGHHGVRRRSRPAVSTATLVPETVDLSGDDAWTTLSRVGKRRLLEKRVPAYACRRRLQPRPLHRLHDDTGRRPGGDRAGRSGQLVRQGSDRKHCRGHCQAGRARSGGSGADQRRGPGPRDRQSSTATAPSSSAWPDAS